MTAFNTCAYPGCSCRIPYDPKKDWETPRYCEEHEVVIETRLSKATGNEDDIHDALYRRIKP